MIEKYELDCSLYPNQFSDTVLGFCAIELDKSNKLIHIVTPISMPHALPLVYRFQTIDHGSLWCHVFELQPWNGTWSINQHGYNYMSDYKFYTDEAFDIAKRNLLSMNPSQVKSFEYSSLPKRLYRSYTPLYFVYGSFVNSPDVKFGMRYNHKLRTLDIGTRNINKGKIEQFISDHFISIIDHSKTRRTTHGTYRYQFIIQHDDFYNGLVSIARSDWVIHRTNSLSEDYRPIGSHMSRISYL